MLVSECKLCNFHICVMKSCIMCGYKIDRSELPIVCGDNDQMLVDGCPKEK
jgi:hypothetical protein